VRRGCSGAGGSVRDFMGTRSAIALPESHVCMCNANASKPSILYIADLAGILRST
jgi:hypothetical protein